MMTLKRVFHNAVSLIIGRRRQTPKPEAVDFAFPKDTPALTTGFSQLDRAMGIKGLPQGRITELIGSDYKGALSITAKIAATFQRKQQPVTIIDMAGSFEPAYAARCGLVAPELLRHIPANAFELINLLEQVARQKGLIIINLGFAPLTFREAGPNILTSLLRRLRQIASSSDSAFLYLTTPEEVDPFIHTNYPPGFPLSEVADIRLWVQDEGWIKRKQQISGYRGNVTVIKNRLAPRGKGANLRIPFVDPGMVLLTEEFGF